MPLELCKKCGRMHYQNDPCAPKRVAIIGHVDHRKTSLTAAITKVLTETNRPTGPITEPDVVGRGEVAAETPATSNPRGRPRIHPDRKAYKAQHERNRRAKLKAQKVP